MFTILSALGGLASSLLPDVIHGIFASKQDKADKAHELEMAQLQLKTEELKSQEQRAAAQQHWEEINLQADTAESAALSDRGKPVGVKWVDALNASVRPVVTYVFFSLFCFHLIVAIGVSVGWIGHGQAVAAVAVAWGEEVQALFAAVMGYWFGARAMQHAREALRGR